MITKEIKNDYLGQVQSAHSSLSDEDKGIRDFVMQRMSQMSLIKSEMADRWQRNQNLIDIFLQTHRMAEEGMPPIRFPTAFGMHRRLYAELMENRPEAEIESVLRTSDGLASAQALSHTLQDAKQNTNYMREIKKVMKDVAGATGNGILNISYKIDDTDSKPIFRRVDPRNFLMDETSLELHNDDSESLRARDCCEVVLMSLTSFRRYAKKEGYRNIDRVYGVNRATTIGSLVQYIYYAEQIRDGMTSGEYVQLAKYYNQELDLYYCVANGIPVHSGKLTDEYDNGKLPYVQYKMYERNDLPWADSWVDVVYEILVQNDLLNTFMMDQLKFVMNKPMVVDGNLGFNTEGELMRPGAVLRVNGLRAGEDIRNRLQVLDTGTIDQNYYQVRTILSDELTMATGDDMRGLYANPNQLATQTAYKQRTLNKLIKNVAISNEADTVIDETKLIIDILAQIYREAKDKPVITVRGFKVKQGARGKRLPVFEKSPNTEDSFILVSAIFDGKYRVKISGKTQKDIDNEDSLKNTLSFLQTILPIAQSLPDFTEKFDMYALIYDIADRLGVDIAQVFPQTRENSISDADVIIQDILQGRDPDLSLTEPFQVAQDLLQITTTSTYKNMSLLQRQSVENAIRKLLETPPKEQNQTGELKNQVMRTDVRIPSPQAAAMPATSAESPVANSQTFKTIGQ